MASRSRLPARPLTGKAGTRSGYAEGNALLTTMTAAVLTVLLAALGVTILDIGGLVTEHMLLGLALIPPVFLKLASTGYRFVRYYSGSGAYTAKGPRACPCGCWPRSSSGPRSRFSRAGSCCSPPATRQARC
jgi:hypothetical protein